MRKLALILIALLACCAATPVAAQSNEYEVKKCVELIDTFTEDDPAGTIAKRVELQLRELGLLCPSYHEMFRVITVEQAQALEAWKAENSDAFVSVLTLEIWVWKHSHLFDAVGVLTGATYYPDDYPYETETEVTKWGPHRLSWMRNASSTEEVASGIVDRVIEWGEQ